MKKLYVVIGPPGSGKSTFISNNLSDKFIVSRDAIRLSMIKDDEDYFSHETAVYNAFIKEIKSGLDDNKEVVADATHLNISARSKLFSSLGSSLKNVEVIGIVFKTPLKTCLERNSKRTGRAFVPESAVVRMYNSMSIPENEEGFDKVYIVN